MRGATIVAYVVFEFRGFQSTLPMRGATYTYVLSYSHREFQSTLPMRGATDVVNLGTIKKEISIHASHAGSD